MDIDVPNTPPSAEDDIDLSEILDPELMNLFRVILERYKLMHAGQLCSIDAMKHQI